MIRVKLSRNKLMLCAVSRQITSHSTLMHRLFEADSMNYGTVNVVTEHASKAQRGGRCMAPPILNLSTRQRSIFISFNLFAFIDPNWYMSFGYGICQ